MRFLWTLLSLVQVLPGATLQRLSLEDMIQKSTEIVSAKVTSSSAVVRGPVVYTKYTVAVTTQWKGAPSKQLDVYVPGGKSGALVQRFSGAPSLAEGVEYVLFLWSGRSGMRQVIGLSQGLFQMVPATQGEAMVKHAASRETMVDASGKVVEDTPASMRLREMVDRIHRTLAGAQVQ